MSVIVGIRAAQGLVLATDSLTRRGDAVFLSASKRFTCPSQPHIAVAACGLLSLGRGELRSLAVLMDAFAADIAQSVPHRMATYLFADTLSDYLSGQ
ncbi:MAG: hypothetical protein QM692_16870 [Thermomicrobiales bacterium]